MPFVAGAVLWGAYTLGWWGWLALTDHVPAGQENTIWWPSLLDLVKPGSIGKAVPPRVGAADVTLDLGGSTPAPSGGGQAKPAVGGAAQKAF